MVTTTYEDTTFLANLTNYEKPFIEFEEIRKLQSCTEYHEPDREFLTPHKDETVIKRRIYNENEIRTITPSQDLKNGNILKLPASD